MKVLNRLTIKHLLMNKKRTIVTIIGITLSMALMLGCGLLVSSFIEEMKTETIRTNGGHHIKFDSLSFEQAKTIQENINVEKSYFTTSLGFANFSDSINASKPYYFVSAASKPMLETFRLVEGRLPENDQEVVISEHIDYNGGKKYQLGDMMDLDIGPRVFDEEETFQNEAFLFDIPDSIRVNAHKTYQVVGIIRRPYTEDYSAAGYSIFTLANEMSTEYPNNLFVQFYKPKDTFELGSEISKNLSLDSHDVQYNSGLLYYYGTTRYRNINESILKVLSIALTLLSVGCIIVIYNSFAISTMERKKQFGLYSSIGATRKQILHTVFFEAFVVGTIGIILGILGSFLGIYIVLQILNYLLHDLWSYEFSLVINWIYILVPIGFMILVVFFSALIPARRASRVTPIVAIRENDDIKMPKRKLKTPKFVTKLFGIEGELALKNMKRNKRKYRITILSLFISIVLFISFSTYLTYGVSSMDSIDYYDYDISVGVIEDDLSTLKEVQKDDRVLENYLYFTSNYQLKIPLSAYTKEYREYREGYNRLNSVLDESNFNLVVLEDDVYQEYASRIQTTADVILFNEGQFVVYGDEERISYHQQLIQDTSTSFKLCDYEDYCVEKSFSISYTNEYLPTFRYIDYQPDLIGFISNHRYQEFIKEGILFDEVESRYYTLQLNADDYETLYHELQDKFKNNNSYVGSPKQELKEQKNQVLAIKLLLYGFISLITLIGVTSVFNTIHTSINLRRKEFAMLRSMGLSPSGFNKMILFESLFFGLKSLLYGLPVSGILILLIHNSMSSFSRGEGILIPWGSILFAICGVFLIVLVAMGYSVNKIRKENILDCIRDENI